MIVTLYDRLGPILDNSWMTLLRTLLGFAIAVVLGVLLGLAIGSSRIVYRGLYPILIGFKSTSEANSASAFDRCSARVGATEGCVWLCPIFCR